MTITFHVHDEEGTRTYLYPEQYAAQEPAEKSLGGFGFDGAFGEAATGLSGAGAAGSFEVGVGVLLLGAPLGIQSVERLAKGTFPQP